MQGAGVQRSGAMAAGLVVLIVGLAGPALAAGREKAEFDRFEAELQKAEQHLQQLRQKHSEASADQRPQIIEQFNAGVQEHGQLLSRLVDAAYKAYRAEPNRHDRVNRIMIGAVQKHIEEDRYDEALKFADAMIEHNFPDKRVLDLAGIAAFRSNRFEVAEQRLAAAQEAGALSQEGRRLRELVPAYRNYWAEEQAIREREAKADDLPRVRLNTTAGPITLELFENQAPNTVANFIHLVEKGFYNGTVFHRVLPNFMAQGGDPGGTGRGGPGWAIRDELGEGYRRHFRGSLSMAHAGADTGGSQFFLTFVPTTHLDGRHTVFGRVIDGWETLARLQRINPGEAGEPTKINSATVTRKRDYDYVPEKLPSRR